MFWLRFSLRSCIRRRRRTAVTLFGIAFGVATLIVLGAIMVGVNDTMVENAVGLRGGHIVAQGAPAPMQAAAQDAVRWANAGKGVSPVHRALPRCCFSALLEREDRVVPAQIWCVDPHEERTISPIPRSVVAGEYVGQASGLLLGAAAAEELAIGVQDTITVVTPERDYEVRITGLFKTGDEILDRSMAFVPLSMANMFGASNATMEVAYFCQAGADLEGVKQRVREAGGDVGVRVMMWQEKLPDVAQLVKLNEFSMRIMVILVVALLGFGVANALLLSVMDRYRYYAILKAIGVRPGEILVTVLGEGLLMCLAAGLMGTLLGIAASALWGRIGLDLARYTSMNPHFSINSVVHPRVELAMALVPQLLALAAGVVASFWPALVAARRRVSAGMRDL